MISVLSSRKFFGIQFATVCQTCCVNVKQMLLLAAVFVRLRLKAHVELA